MADHSLTGAFRIALPKDLVSESKRATKPKSEQLKIDGMRTSWLTRLSEVLVGKG